VIARRIGLVVPSFNTTIEVELPELLRRREAVAPERFSCHASRVRMRHVTPSQLVRMNVAAERCVGELADARCDALVYACLTAIMTEGPGAHLTAEKRLSAAAVLAGHGMPVVSSAGALVSALAALGARRIALIAPYAPSLTDTVVGYFAACGVQVVDAISLGVTDNVEIGRYDPVRLIGLAEQLDLDAADAVVLSVCVALPSLPAVPVVERRLGLPVLTAATATAHQLLTLLELPPDIPDAGRLLAMR
jgi:maleate isomerase